LLEQTAPLPVELKPLEARFLELPPAAGLQGGESTPARPAPHIVGSAKPLVVPKTMKHHETKTGYRGPRIPFRHREAFRGGTAIRGESIHRIRFRRDWRNWHRQRCRAWQRQQRSACDNAPTPNIPDDIRGDAFQGVALAHFKVSYNSDVEITLLHPTSSPRLNGILLDTLKQWRFFPAMKNGVAVDSEFDVRIPISIR
jgi:protein TonB